MSNEKIITLDLLSQFKGLMDTAIAEGDETAVKALDYADNTIKIYRTEDKSDVPTTISLPEELFLDQTKTKFVGDFVWSETEYPGSTDPDLEGKPVMVLAVKGDTTTTYSFVNLETLVNISTGANTATANTTVTSGNKILVDVNVSSAADNVLVVRPDGLYVAKTDALTFATASDIDALFS